MVVRQANPFQKKNREKKDLKGSQKKKNKPPATQAPKEGESGGDGGVGNQQVRE